MPRRAPYVICANCHDRIGAYEPLWLQLFDHVIRSSSLLHVPERMRGAPWRHYHHTCLAGLHEVRGARGG